jgi:hypothetical protein
MDKNYPLLAVVVDEAKTRRKVRIPAKGFENQRSRSC